MTNMLRNERGYYLTSDEVRAALWPDSRRGGHLPLTEAYIWKDGVKFWLKPYSPRYYTQNDGSVHAIKSSKHRLFFQCTCNRWVPCGRAHQHKCK